MKRHRFQFQLRTLLLIIPVIAIALAWTVNGVRRQQQYHQAWLDLAILDMGSTIGYGIRFHSRRRTWTQADVDELIRIIEVLGRRRDFGFKSGIHVDVIDFKGSQITDESLARIRHIAPATEIVR